MSLITIIYDNDALTKRTEINRQLLMNKVEQWLTHSFNMASTNLECESLIKLADENGFHDLAKQMTVDMANGKNGIEY